MLRWMFLGFFFSVIIQGISKSKKLLGASEIKLGFSLAQLNAAYYSKQAYLGLYNVDH